MLCSNGLNKIKFADFEQYFDGFFSIYFISVVYDHSVANECVNGWIYSLKDG